jgi:hypothetical protein
MKPMLRRFVWFAALWATSVLVFLVIAYVARLALPTP